MRGTFTYYFQCAFCIQSRLPAYDIDIAKSFTCAFIGFRAIRSDLEKIFDAGRDIVEALIVYCLNRNNDLVGHFVHAREGQFFLENLRTFPEMLGIPDAIFSSCLRTTDSARSRANERATYAAGNRA